MDDEQLEELVTSIRENGQLVPIETYEDKILDGRNRYLACLRAEVEPEFYETDCDGLDPLEYVRALNDTRRHLDETMRAMIAARHREWHDKRAKERQGRRTDLQDNLPGSETGQSRDKAGQQFQVSGKTVDHATKVVKQGSAELQRLCDHGIASVSAAARIAELPKSEQNEVIKDAKASGNTKKAIAAAAKSLTSPSNSPEPTYPASDRFSRESRCKNARRHGGSRIQSSGHRRGSRRSWELIGRQ
jgi:hypothetical protein